MPMTDDRRSTTREDVAACLWCVAQEAPRKRQPPVYTCKWYEYYTGACEFHYEKYGKADLVVKDWRPIFQMEMDPE